MMPASQTRVWVDYLYVTLLGRSPDPGGETTCRAALEKGVSRRDLAQQIVGSEEHINRVVSATFDMHDLSTHHPQRYRKVRAVDGHQILVLECSRAEHFDWIETEIDRNDYYEKPGVWSYSLSDDKRVMAEVIDAFEPASVLEIGCSNGAILSCLAARGVRAEGVDISVSAIAKADPSIRNNIHLGDLLDLELAEQFDVVFGLDIFEHLNPNRLASYLRKAVALLRPGGYLFANIPAYGVDPVYGCVFEPQLTEWEADRALGRPYRLLPVDLHGYPLHGHLIWAHSEWWVKEFEAAGLVRQELIERALHARYDAFWAAVGPARQAFYVFSNSVAREDLEHLVARIQASGSQVVGKVES